MDPRITSNEIGINALVGHGKHERASAAPKAVTEGEQEPEPQSLPQRERTDPGASIGGGA